MKTNFTPLVRLVDDDADFRASQKLFLMTLGFETAEYESAQAFLADLQPLRPGCVLLDIRMPGMTGLELQREIETLSRRIPIIFLTGHGDVQAAVRAMKYGAADFFEKRGDPMQVMKAVERACEKSVAIFRAFEEEEARVSAYRSLTAREREVFTQAASGLSNKEIAQKLGIGPETVKMHRANAFGKLNVKSALEAYQWLELLPERVRPESVS